MRLTLRTQIVLVCLTVVFPLAATEAFVLLNNYRSERREALVNSRREANAIAAAASALMLNLQNSAQVLAQEAQVANGHSDRIQSLLERAVRLTKIQTYASFVLPDGHIGPSAPQAIGASGPNLVDRPFFQALRAGAKWQLVNFVQRRVNGIPVWGVAAAVRAGGRFQGAVIVSVPATEFDRLIPVQMPPGTWSIVDHRGQLVYLNGMPEATREDRDRSKGELVRRALAGEDATSEDFAGMDGLSRLGASVSIQPFGWVVEVSQPVAEVMALARRQCWIEGSKYIPALALAILIAVLLGNRVGPPLARLTAAADRVAQGQYDVAAEPGGPSELAHLITAFNTMSTSLARRQRWDEALKAIGRTARAGMPLGEILSSGLEAMMQAAGATLGLVRLVDPGTKELVVAAHRNLPKEYLDVAERIPWGAKLAGYVAYTGESWLIGRLQEQPEVSHLSLLAGLQCLACLPLKAHDRLVGTITLGHHQPTFFGSEDLPLLMPAASMLADAIVAEQIREATTREAEERALLFRELDHRVRNNLAVLISLLHLGAEGAEGSAAGKLREMANRVARLAEVHNLLTGRGMQPIEVRELAETVAKNVLAALPGDVRIRWKVIGVPVRVSPSQVTAIALILNELLTNCTKHAFTGRSTGTISIRVLHEGGQIGLDVQDDGVGLDPNRHLGGLGLTIVQALATQNLRGSMRYACKGGILVSIRFPQQEQYPMGGAV